jgi:hypothetical protein
MPLGNGSNAGYELGLSLSKIASFSYLILNKFIVSIYKPKACLFIVGQCLRHICQALPWLRRRHIIIDQLRRRQIITIDHGPS